MNIDELITLMRDVSGEELTHENIEQGAEEYGLTVQEFIDLTAEHLRGEMDEGLNEELNRFNGLI